MKNKLKQISDFIIHNVFIFFIGILITGTTVYAATVISGSSISYDNSNSTLSATNVQDALDELNEKSQNFCPQKYTCLKKYESPKVGDYVQMTPTLASFTTSTTYTGYKNTQTINPQELNLWRVLQINSDGTIELISEYASSVAITFTGRTGYLNFVGYLNVLASQYENSKYTIGSRYVGYNGQTEYITDTTKIDSTTAPWTSNTGSGTVESQGGGDQLYQKDYNLIEEVLGTRVAYKVGTVSTASYWLASRYYGYGSTKSFRYIGSFIGGSGSYTINMMMYYYNGSQFLANGGGISNNLRPIVILKSGIEYQPALGTKEYPFVLK